jgi:hypothetical protein
VMQEPIEATAPITIVLQAQQWNVLLGVLAEGPYRVVAPLIGAITEQAAHGHQERAGGAGSAAAAPRPNGAGAIQAGHEA